MEAGGEGRASFRCDTPDLVAPESLKWKPWRNKMAGLQPTTCVGNPTRAKAVSLKQVLLLRNLDSCSCITNFQVDEFQRKKVLGTDRVM